MTAAASKWQMSFENINGAEESPTRGMMLATLSYRMLNMYNPLKSLLKFYDIRFCS
jgi:hypothetical protein